MVPHPRGLPDIEVRHVEDEFVRQRIARVVAEVRLDVASAICINPANGLERLRSTRAGRRGERLDPRIVCAIFTETCPVTLHDPQS